MFFIYLNFKDALLSGDIDLVWGAGVLPDSDIRDIINSPQYQERIRVFHSDVIQNKMMILNSGMPPFNDINVRKAVIRKWIGERCISYCTHFTNIFLSHLLPPLQWPMTDAIQKNVIVEKELNGLAKTVDNIFPLEAPFCDIDLTPKWDYDLEKAAFLSCIEQTGSNSKSFALGLGLGLGIPLAIMSTMAFVYYKKNDKLQAELKVRGDAEVA